MLLKRQRLVTVKALQRSAPKKQMLVALLREAMSADPRTSGTCVRERVSTSRRSCKFNSVDEFTKTKYMMKKVTEQLSMKISGQSFRRRRESLFTIAIPQSAPI